MNVILKADVKGQGKAGQLVKVSDGYARNFLFPKNLAVPADNAAMSEMKSKQESARHKIEMEQQYAKQQKDLLDGKTLKISAKGGTGGRLFGSVTSKEISEKIKEEFKTEIDKRKIVCKDIKTFGAYTAEIKLYNSVVAKITVLVEEELN